MNIPDKPSCLVFVYGTLKNMNKGEFIGEARTLDPMILYGGGFPVLDLGLSSIDSRRGRVLGQLYRVNMEELESLDTYEGYPDYYDRTMLPVSVRLPGNQGATVFHKAWIYHGRTDMSGVMNSTYRRPILEPDENGTVHWDQSNPEHTRFTDIPF